MQGVKGRFVATLKELFYTELPALTDDRARELMTDCNSFAEVKAAITQRWEQDVQAATDRRISEAITDEIAGEGHELGEKSDERARGEFYVIRIPSTKWCFKENILSWGEVRPDLGFNTRRRTGVAD